MSGFDSRENVATEIGRFESFVNPNSETYSPELSCSQMSHWRLRIDLCERKMNYKMGQASASASVALNNA